MVEAGGAGGVERREDRLPVGASAEVEKPVAVGAETDEVGDKNERSDDVEKPTE